MKIEDVEVVDYSDMVERIFGCNDIDGIKFWGPAVVHACRIQFAQIEHLKAELDLRTRERDQAIAFGEIIRIGRALRNGQKDHHSSESYPDLFAHLAGRGE